MQLKAPIIGTETGGTIKSGRRRENSERDGGKNKNRHEGGSYLAMRRALRRSVNERIPIKRPIPYYGGMKGQHRLAAERFGDSYGKYVNRPGMGRIRDERSGKIAGEHEGPAEDRRS